MTPTTTADEARAREALNRIVDPKSGRGLAAAGLARGLTVEGGRAGFMLEVAAADAALYAPVRLAAEKALAALPGIERAQVVLTTATPAQPQVVQRRTAAAAHDPRADTARLPPAQPLANVKRVIAVASGKGGVGKSTVAVNLACAFRARGLAVGLLDADVYGPSAPTMLGVTAKPTFEDGKLTPLEAHGLKVMSMGFVVGEAMPMIWRGPMVSSAVRQMIEEVRWAEPERPLDVLVVDLPPGTGDIHLTLVQKLKLDGVVIVSTPQELALIDARRAAGMFQRMNPPVPILGVVENMAWFPDPSTGARIPIFGEGGARAEAARLGVPFLGEIPIELALRQAGDTGRSIADIDPAGPVARAFRDMAAALAGPEQ
ncbi:MAG: Mrp/NBP35 family ATP-binding protein [Caulobacteraceae bacterium]|nr:Mrp/NBP35 family ATP-binding protein [Caulobacteraceae bacterium]